MFIKSYCQELHIFISSETYSDSTLYINFVDVLYFICKKCMHHFLKPAVFGQNCADCSQDIIVVCSTI